MNYIFIDVRQGIERVGVVENNRLVEFYIDSGRKEKIIGNIYRGRVVNIVPGMESAFVDIGVGKNAYLHVKDALPKELLYKEKKVNIGDILKVGQDIIVQVTRDSVGNKGPKITSHITLPGNFLVLTPFSHSINISKKIQDTDEINRLSRIGENIKKGDVGFIFRTRAKGVEEEVFREEYSKLLKLYKKIERERRYLPSPKLIYKDINLINKILRDAYNERVHKITVNNIEEYDSLLNLEEVFFPNLQEKLHLDENFNIDYEKNIQRDIKDAIRKKVNLKSGGYIVIDEVEAFTIIDVNTGKYIGDDNLEDTVLRTNIEAAWEIAIQIRLRDLGGIIIIDFIDMRNKEDKKILLEELNKALSYDRNRANVIGITKLGLVEMTRKKMRNSFRHELIKECPYCEGQGKILG